MRRRKIISPIILLITLCIFVFYPLFQSVGFAGSLTDPDDHGLKVATYLDSYKGFINGTTDSVEIPEININQFKMVYNDVEGISGGKVIGFADITQNSNNGYPLISETDLDTWVSYFGGVPNFVQNKAKKYTVKHPFKGNFTFYNWSEVAALSGGGAPNGFYFKVSGSNYIPILRQPVKYGSSKVEIVNINGSTSSSVTVKEGENVSFTLKATDGSYYIVGSRPMYWTLNVNAPGIYYSKYYSMEQVYHNSGNTKTVTISKSNLPRDVSTGNYAFQKAGTYNLEFTMKDSTYHDVAVVRKTVIVEPNLSPFMTTTAKANPSSFQVGTTDIPVQVNVEGVLSKVSAASNVASWVLYARKNEETQAQQLNFAGNTLSRSGTFMFTVPASLLSGKDFHTQYFTVSAVANLTNGTQVRAQASTFTYLYKDKPGTTPTGGLQVQLKCLPCLTHDEAEDGRTADGNSNFAIEVENPKGDGYLPFDEVFDSQSDYDKYGLKDYLLLAVTSSGKVVLPAAGYSFERRLYHIQESGGWDGDPTQTLIDWATKHGNGEISIYDFPLKDIDVGSEDNRPWLVGVFLVWESGEVTYSTSEVEIDNDCAGYYPPKYPPIASFSAPNLVEVGEEVFLKDQSYDRDGTITDWFWSSDSYVDVETNFTNGSSSLTIQSPKTIFVNLQVKDNDGQLSTNDAKTQIQAVIPKPTAGFKVVGVPKSNRLLKLDGSLSEELSSDRINSKYPINWDAAEWTIAPVSEGLASTDIKIGALSTGKVKEVLFKKPGIYQASLKVQNSRGDWSRPVIQEIEIVADENPSIQIISKDTLINREPEHTYQAIIDAKVSASSTEFYPDYIGQFTWYVTYDQNNDGVFSEQKQTILNQTISGDLSSTTSYLQHAVSAVGKYKVDVVVKEMFGQPTLPEFILPADYRTSSTSFVVEIDNVAPTFSLDILEVKETQLHIDHGSLSRNSLVDNANTIRTSLIPKGVNATQFYGEQGVQEIPATYGADWEPYINVPADIGKGTTFVVRQIETSNQWEVLERGNRIYSFSNVKFMRDFTHATGEYYATIAEENLEVEGGQKTDVFSRVYLLTRSKDGVWSKQLIYNNPIPPMDWGGGEYSNVNRLDDVTFSASKDPRDTYVFVHEQLDYASPGWMLAYDSGTRIQVYHRKGSATWSKVYNIESPTQDLSTGRLSYEEGLVKRFVPFHLTGGDLYLQWISKTEEEDDDVTKRRYYSNLTKLKGGSIIREDGSQYAGCNDGCNYSDNKLWIMGSSGTLIHRLKREDDRDRQYYDFWVVDSATGGRTQLPSIRENGDNSISTITRMDLSDNHTRFYVAVMTPTTDFQYYDDRITLDQTKWTLKYYPVGGTDWVNGYTEMKYTELPVWEGYKLTPITKANYIQKLISDDIKLLPWSKSKENFLVIFADNDTVQDFSTPDKTNLLVDDLKQNGIGVIGVGKGSVLTKMQNLVNQVGGGKTFSIDSSDSTIYGQIVDYISSKVRETTALFQTAFLGSEVDYSTIETDYENDPIIKRSWKFDHQLGYNHPTYGWVNFDNNQGMIENNNIWQDERLSSFDKVGHYRITGKIKDDPTKSNVSLIPYQKESDEDSEEYVVHRKPTALFTTIPKLGYTLPPIVQEFINLDYSTKNSYSANWNKVFVNLTGEEIAEVSFQTPTITVSPSDTYWDYGYVRGYNPVTRAWEYVKQYDNGSIRIKPTVSDSFTLESKNYTQLEIYFRVRTNSYNTIPAKSTISNSYMKVVSSADSNLCQDLTFNDLSYDIDHTSRMDKGIEEREWAWREKGMTTWNTGSNPPSTIPLYKTYEIQLRVKDIEEAWSHNSGLGFSLEIGNSMINTPPVALFELDRTNYYKSIIPIITDKSFDPDGHPIVRWNWRLQNLNTGVWSTLPDLLVSGFDISGLTKGSYKLELMVEDSPPATLGTSLQSQPYSIEFSIDNTPPTASLVNFNGISSGPVIIKYNNPNLQWSAYDADGDPLSRYKVEVLRSDGTLEASSGEVSGWATSWRPTLTDGSKYWHVQVYDGEDWSTWSSNGWFFVDTQKPMDTNEMLTISPTSVIVNMNTFNDPSPSSGHQKRMFYMQKVNAADGSVTNIDLDGNGTTEYDIQIPNTQTAYTVNGLVTGQGYRVCVIDYDKANNEGYYTYIYFVTNRPPVAGFKVAPNPIWEGDTVQITSTASDPDGDVLSYSYEITNPGGNKSSYSTANPSFKVTIPGSWSVKQTVTDTNSASDSISNSFLVGSLTVSGQVTHTPDWEMNRQQWNAKFNPDRPTSMFWAGEKFVLNASTTNTGSATKATSVTAKLMEKNVSSTLSSVNVPTNTFWGGEMWQSDFEQLPDGFYNFEFKSVWSNGTTKIDVIMFQIKDSVWDVVGTHRVH